MKVLMVTPTFYPFIGGVETVVKELTVKLNEIGITTDVMTSNIDKKLEPIWRDEIINKDGFKIFRISALNPKIRINPFKVMFNMNIILKPHFTKLFRNYDLIHFHGDSDLSFPIFSYFIHKPKILHCHTLILNQEYYKKYFFKNITLKKVVNYYICNSNFESNLLLNLGIPKNRFFTLYNGVDSDFKPDRNKKIDDLILFVGRVDGCKGLHILLKSLIILKRQVKLIIIGPILDREYYEEIQKQITTVNLNGIHSVIYLGDIDRATDKESLINWYQKASVFVCPSLSDSNPIVNLEALACGTPVIGTSVGGIPEIIKDDINGFLIPPNDPEKLATALEKLLENKKLREKYGIEGRRIVKQSFLLIHMAEELAVIYEKIVKQMS